MSTTREIRLLNDTDVSANVWYGTHRSMLPGPAIWWVAGRGVTRGRCPPLTQDPGLVSLECGLSLSPGNHHR